MQTLHPPALISEAESFSGIMAEVGRINEEICRNDRMNLDRIVKMGRKLIRAYEMRVEGQWLQDLEKIGVSSQRSSEAMRIARLPAPGLGACQSIADALKKVRELPRKSAKIVPKRKPKKLHEPCERCARIGIPSCEECYRHFPDGFPDATKAGDEAPFEGEITYDMKKWGQAKHKVWQEFDRAADVFAVSRTPKAFNTPPTYAHPLLERAKQAQLESERLFAEAVKDLRRKSRQA